MVSSELRKQLPQHLFRKSNLWPLYYTLHGLVLWLGLGYLALLTFQVPEMSDWLRYSVIAVLLGLAGLGLAHMGTLGHEGFHGNLNRNRRLSMLMGIVTSSMVPFYMVVGYSVTHWQHHLFTNQEQDPDYRFFRGRDRLLTRFLNGPVTLTGYMTMTLAITFNPEKVRDNPYPFKPREAWVFAITNLLCLLVSLSGYLYLAMTAPLESLVMLGIPYLVASTYVSLLPYIEHGDIDPRSPETTRSYISPLFTLVFLGLNYHREHHLFPGVQIHKLPALHRQLVARDLVPGEAVIETGFLRTLKTGALAEYLA
jgi:beta-carotene hydroxylase